MSLTKASLTTLAAAVAFAITSAVTLAASPFAGEWSVKDTSGKPFEITLSPDGTAKANLHPEMIGTWKQAGDSAVISWKTGWTTKTKTGDHTPTWATAPASRRAASQPTAPTHRSSNEIVNGQLFRYLGEIISG